MRRYVPSLVATGGTEEIGTVGFEVGAVDFVALGGDLFFQTSGGGGGSRFVERGGGGSLRFGSRTVVVADFLDGRLWVVLEAVLREDSLVAG